MGDGRTEKVTFTCTPDLKEFLIEWAAKERRSLSNLVEGIVTEAIEAQQQGSPASGTTGGKGRGKKGVRGD
jgi:hypothetical protein